MGCLIVYLLIVFVCVVYSWMLFSISSTVMLRVAYYPSHIRFVSDHDSVCVCVRMRAFVFVFVCMYVSVRLHVCISVRVSHFFFLGFLIIII